MDMYQNLFHDDTEYTPPRVSIVSPRIGRAFVHFRGILRVAFFVVTLLLILAAVAWRGSLPSTSHRASPVKFNDPHVLLAKANHLSWLGNWYAAGPLYAEAEKEFHEAGDKSDEIYARVGRIRAHATVVPL